MFLERINGNLLKKYLQTLTLTNKKIMTKKIILLVLAVIGASNYVSARGGIPIPVCFPCESIEIVEELPNNSEIQELAGEQVDIAYLNNEYGAIWVPVWNTDGRFVLSNKAKTTYYEIDDETAKILKEKHNFDITTADNPLSFWTKIGGKLLVGALALLMIWGQIPSKEDKVKPTNV